MLFNVMDLQKEDLVSDTYRDQLIYIMQESEEDNYPQLKIEDNFGEREYERLKCYFLEEKANLSVAMIEKKICGYIWYFLYNEWVHVNEIAVIKEYRKKGVGRTLIARAYEYAKKANAPGVELFVLETNNMAGKFYEKEGFYTSKRLLRKEV